MSEGKPKVPLLKAIAISAVMVGAIMLGLAGLQREQMGDEVAGMVVLVGGAMLVVGIVAFAVHALTGGRKG
jgi:hypothetical protein